MSEIISTSLFGIAFIVISIVFLHKEKYVGSMILKYLSSYMYCSLAYTTYTVVMTEQSQIMFIALALATLGDIAFGLKYVIEKYSDLVHYAGILLYIGESVAFSIVLTKCCNALLYVGLIGVAFALIVIYLITRKKKDLSIFSLILNTILLASVYFAATLSITSLFNAANLTKVLLSIGTILIVAGSTCFVIDEYSEYDYFFLKACNLACRYTGQLLATISMVFVFYI